MPGALELLVGDPTLELDALILPGHVSTIIGAEPYRFLAEKYGIPGVITGFEPVDVLQGIAMLVRQLHEGRAEIEIAYARGVMRGKSRGPRRVDEVFETCTATWRGLGDIPGSGIAFAMSSPTSTRFVASSPMWSRRATRRDAAAATCCGPA